MIRLLIDTCVWLDLARDYDQVVFLDVLERLLACKQTELIVPRTVLDEFLRNRDQVIEAGGRSITSALRRTRDIIKRLGASETKDIALGQIGEVDFQIPRLKASAIESLSRVETILYSAAIVETSEEILLSAARRAVNQEAPFHRQRNSIGDAVIIETYIAELQNDPHSHFAFITHNTKDFSNTGDDNRCPHPDLAGSFGERSFYFVTLAQALRSIDPEAVSEAMVEREWHEEPRQLAEILTAMDEFADKIWYDRHQMLASRVEQGQIQVVEQSGSLEPHRQPHTIPRAIWEGAVAAAVRLEQQYGIENLGPWSAYEWGMISGKLSALRWVLGDEWDMLDT